MNLLKVRFFACFIAGLFLYQPISYAGGKKKYHCEKEKNGKIVDLPKVKSRKRCKKLGGKWMKEHSHGHADHDHSHGDHEQSH